MAEKQISALAIHKADWKNLLEDKSILSKLEKTILPAFFKKTRWFGGKSKRFNLELSSYLRIPNPSTDTYLMLIEADDGDEYIKLYQLAISFVPADIAKLNGLIENSICPITLDAEDGFIIDAVYENKFREQLFKFLKQEKTIRFEDNLLKCQAGTAIKAHSGSQIPVSKVLKADQSNTSILYGNQYFLKLIRKLEFAPNSELEMNRFLTNHTSYTNAPSYEGSIQIINQGSKSTVIGMVQSLIQNKGDAWTLYQKLLKNFYRDIASNNKNLDPPPSAIDIARYSLKDIKTFLQSMIGNDVYEKIKLLASRTAELHIALSSDRTDPDFKPVHIDEKYRKRLYKSLKKLVKTRFQMLESKLDELPSNVATEARQILSREKEILKFFKKRLKKEIAASRIRIHGDYHLGQVLFTGDDYYIIDFEGEPDKSYDERRLKHIPLKDVAGMIRSFHYAVHAALIDLEGPASESPYLIQWAELWYHAVSRFFLETYISSTKGEDFIPKKKILVPILQLYLLEKAIYELGYEMNNRPDWVGIPIKGVKHFINNYIDDQENSD